MDPVKQSFLKTDEPVEKEEKKPNKVVAAFQKVRARAKSTSELVSPRLSTRISLLRHKANPDLVEEPAARPKVAHVTPATVWKPTQVQEAKETIATLLHELADLIPRTRLSITDKRKHALTYLYGLRAILKAGIGHLDLKPANILWGKDSFVISDFNASIIIDEVWKLTDKRFIFESEEEKSSIRRMVLYLLDPDPKPLKSPHVPSIQKLVDLEILHTSALESFSKEAVYDLSKLRDLKEYTATQFLPPPTPGYASNQYRNAMCHYFWRGEKENFSLACQAFDMRAAALTIYGIFAGTQPPEREDDHAYYDKMESTLITLELSRTAASLIRGMAEPTVPPLGEPFRLPISLVEIETLIDEIYQASTPPIQVESSEEEEEGSSDNEASKSKLEKIQAALANLSVLDRKEEPSDDQSVIRKITEELLGAKADFPVMGINKEIRKLLIEKAFAAYADQACESTLEDDDKTYNIVLLLDPTDLQSCDLVIKEKRIGEGGSAVAYKAFSLRSSQHVVLKYFLETADPLEASNAKSILEYIRKHKDIQPIELEAIQPSPKLFSLQVKEDYQKVTLEPYYENCDYASCIFGDLFCSKWNIKKEKVAIFHILQQIDRNVQKACSESTSPNEIQKHIDAFECEYGKTFTGILGQQKAMSLFGSYRILASSIPTSRLRSVSISYLEVDEITQLVQNCLKIVPNISGITTIDIEALRDTIKHKPSYEQDLKAKAREFMIRSIRKCQGLALLEWLAENSRDQENPHGAVAEWEKKAKKCGDEHLDLNGLNHISKNIFEKVHPIAESIPQITLRSLNTILKEIAEITLGKEIGK